MVLARQLTESRFDLVRGGATGDAEGFVVIAGGHGLSRNRIIKCRGTGLILTPALLAPTPCPYVYTFTLIRCGTRHRRRLHRRPEGLRQAAQRGQIRGPAAADQPAARRRRNRSAALPRRAFQ